MDKVIAMCGGMKFMNPTEEMKKRCICNYGSCESNVSITVSLDELSILINGVRKELDNMVILKDIAQKRCDNVTLDDVEGTKIFELTKLLTNLEKLRQE